MLNLNQLKNIYLNSPLWVKRLYCSIPYDIRNGSDFSKWSAFLKSNLNYEEYQQLKIRETLLYAYDNTIYYKRLFDDLRFSVTDLGSDKDFEKIPIINKKVVRTKYSQFCVKNFPEASKFYVTTGGTSGAPMKFLQSKNVWKKELAFQMNFFSKFGYKPSHLRASFRGGEFNDLKIDQYFKFNPIHNELHFSPFHINEKNIWSYVKDLNKYMPTFFLTYLSSILLLIEHMKIKNLVLNYKVNAIFLISENFTLKDIKIIEDFFGADVASYYGHSERLIFAPNSLNNLKLYRNDNRYGRMELVDENSEVIKDNKVRGEIVGTGFDNFAMPLIRYRTNDFTYYENYKKSEISLIEGRWVQEYLVGKNGLKLYLSAINVHSDIFKNIVKYQFYQIEPGRASINLIVNKDFNEKDASNIKETLINKVGHALDIQVKVVTELEFTSRGKLKVIVKHLKNNQLNFSS